MSFDYRHPEVLDAVRRALAEDIGSGDVTTNTCVPAEAMARGRFIARQPLVLAGIGLLDLIYAERGGVAELNLLHQDGSSAAPGDVLATVRGPARTLLECERTSLNFLQRLSGVATVARRYVDAVEGTRCQILDTRKTTPGLRRLEKMAAASGGVRPALERFAGSPLDVEIEVRTRAELEQALDCGARHLLLDNLTPAEAAVWIRVIGCRATAELSGGITLESARAYAEAGADFVSAGAITHSAVAVDINFRLELE